MDHEKKESKVKEKREEMASKIKSRKMDNADWSKYHSWKKKGKPFNITKDTE